MDDSWSRVFHETMRCGLFGDHSPCEDLYITGEEDEVVTGKNGRRQTLQFRTCYCRHDGGFRKIGILPDRPSWCPRLRESYKKE